LSSKRFPVISASGLVQAAPGKRIFRMAPIHHHFRAAWLERIKGNRAVLDRRAGFCTVCADNFEVEVKRV